VNRASLLLLGLLLCAAGSGACAKANDDTPDYSSRKYIFNTSALKPLPYASFISSEALSAYRKCLEENKVKPASQRKVCLDYEYRAPYSMEDETVRVGKDLRQSWQRFEDRYYWRAMLELNNPAMYFTHCLVDWGRKEEARKPEVVINVEKGMYPKQLDGKLPGQAVKDDLFMDSYLILPNVPNKDYCEDYSLDFVPISIPGTCIYAGGAKLFCIEGTQETLNPAAPKPLHFDYNAALRRIASATKKAELDYQKDYQTDVVKAVKPTAKFYPLLWSDMLSGALIAPTQSLNPNPQTILNKAKEAGGKLGGVFGLTAPVYYAQGLTSNKVTLPLRAHVLPGSKDSLQNPPGVWQLEEFKRTFPISAQPVYERFGYTNLFSAWTRAKPLLLPEPVSAKPFRQMIYMASGFNVYLPSLVPVPMPAPILIKEYAAGLPYVGVQTHFTWNSVGEGYPLPRVAGTPPIQYKGMFK